eukprot:TRINITY_DN2186_c0_g1_i1.p1 TRINITY_DN2186_c0_g1~~TRINITY_DN2186_c0_g1_i1.p1  ORF type:complete len:366 (+),score=92.26 TRINITY_DN2186_c0_g1_i1:98-1195(+)
MSTDRGNDPAAEGVIRNAAPHSPASTPKKAIAESSAVAPTRVAPKTADTNLLIGLTVVAIAVLASIYIRTAPAALSVAQHEPALTARQLNAKLGDKINRMKSFINAELDDLEKAPAAYQASFERLLKSIQEAKESCVTKESLHHWTNVSSYADKLSVITDRVAHATSKKYLGSLRSELAATKEELLNTVAPVQQDEILVHAEAIAQSLDAIIDAEVQATTLQLEEQLSQLTLSSEEKQQIGVFVRSEVHTRVVRHASREIIRSVAGLSEELRTMLTGQVQYETRELEATLKSLGELLLSARKHFGELSASGDFLMTDIDAYLEAIKPIVLHSVLHEKDVKRVLLLESFVTSVDELLSHPAPQIQA